MHRGSNLPGYVSLFQRMTSKHLKPDENPEDELDAILETKAGVGGSEGALFALDLLEMYKAYSFR